MDNTYIEANNLKDDKELSPIFKLDNVHQNRN